ncbi:hypothetical protein [Altericista sp. CCNU0014]|uniref:hypothetical protein n=1 Tax=Altericista sp. CCNU0014 TaxID=3082949 RepID=UPI0038510A64
MEKTLERAGVLKQKLLDFVLEAEGDLAISLETYCAEHLSRFAKSHYQGNGPTDLVVDRFLSAGRIGDKTPLQLFLESAPELEERDRNLVMSWQQSFTGLFCVVRVSPDGVELRNWMTAKHYNVKSNGLQSPEQLARLKEEEIVLTRIAPVTPTDWMFSNALILLGKLGKPKLAVAIGNFKQQFEEDLYGDAPELLEEAWNSVEQYHREFVDFFGSSEVTLPGYQANQKLKAFQEVMAEHRLAAMGINGTESFEALAEEAGVSKAEITEVAASAGVGKAAVDELFKSRPPDGKTPLMAPPQVDLPDRLKKAEALTILTHPRWGQMLLPTYHRIEKLLEAEDWQSVENGKNLVLQSLEDAEMNAYVWKHLAEQYPIQLEAVLKAVLDRPHFNLSQDLDKLLQEFRKPLSPKLPETASVPLHLHTLFQDAVKEVHKSQSKQKVKQKTGTGFKIR